MIRFSAGLVAVAIGVLIGGIATSKLLLVYIAIAVSAVALVALAIGVALNREELFGEGIGERRGTAPAQAGASPMPSARASDRDDQNRSNGQVTPPPPPGAPVGPGAAFAANGQATPPQSKGTQENRAGGDSWPSPVTASSFPAARRTAAPFGPPAAGEHPAPRGPAAQRGGAEPRTPGASAPSAFAPRTAGTPAGAPGAGPGASWFSPPGKAASAGSPAPETGAGLSRVKADATLPGDKGAEAQGKAEEQGKAADAPALEDGGWPARYSRLDDKPGPGNHEAMAPGPGDEVDAEKDAGSHVAAPAETDEPEPAAPGLVRDPAPEAGESAVPGELSAATAADDAGLVTVVRGVPRFHQRDCVLIRFMSDDDIQKLSVAQAKEAGCTPCAACQPG